MKAVSLRAPTSDDVPAIVAALEAASAANGLPVGGAEEVETWFTSPTFDVQGNFRVAIGPGGEIVGYADLQDAGNEHQVFYLDLRIPPAHQEAGAPEQLLAWAEARARELAEGRPAGATAAIRLPLVEHYAWGRELAERHGFVPIRHSFEMAIEFDAPPPEPEWPGGIFVRPFRAGEERAVWQVQQETFGDVWGFVPQPFEEWSHFVLGDPDFDSSLNFVAIETGDGPGGAGAQVGGPPRGGAPEKPAAPEEIAGVALCSANARRWPGLGWVDILGVRRPWRRRGLGLALLRHAFGELHRRGRAGVALGVDAKSLTGATRLYERAGMRVVSRSSQYEKIVRGADD